MPTRYGFLLDTYETEILKIVTIWSAFPESKMDFRPAPKSSSSTSTRYSRKAAG